MVERNVGGRDRPLRGALAVVLLVAAVRAYRGGRRGRAAVALVAASGMLFNYATQFCGLNAALGRNTCEVDVGAEPVEAD